MNAHFPPFTKPTGAYDAAKLREDTIALAVSQDRDNDALPSILAEMRALVARLERYAGRKPYDDALKAIKAATMASESWPEAARRDLRDYGIAIQRVSFKNGELQAEHVPAESVYLAPSAEGLTTRVIKPNHDPEHLAWHVTGDDPDFSVERDSAGSRL